MSNEISKFLNKYLVYVKLKTKKSRRSIPIDLPTLFLRSTATAYVLLSFLLLIRSSDSNFRLFWTAGIVLSLKFLISLTNRT